MFKLILKSLKKKYMIDHLIFIGSITLLVVFFSIDMIYADGNNDTYWFQRSGSVVVVLASWLE